MFCAVIGHTRPVLGLAENLPYLAEAQLLCGSEKHYLSTYDVELVDTNGAGDNFAAGFISATLRGMGLYDRAKFATATAGMTVSSLGSSTGVRSMKAVEDFMASHELKPLR